MPLIGNKVVEKDIRNELMKLGMNGPSAKIEDLHLVAIKRPGWLQVFSFHVKAFKDDDEASVEFFGLCRDNEAASTFDLQLFDTPNDRQELLDEWAVGLIRRDRNRAKKGEPNQRGRGQSNSLIGIICIMLILATIVVLALTSIA